MHICVLFLGALTQTPSGALPLDLLGDFRPPDPRLSPYKQATPLLN